MKNLPILFIFDLDLTIIGESKNINYYKYELLGFINQNCEHKKMNGDICKINRNDWIKVIPDGFIRPGFKECVLSIKETFPTAEFFIFSNGTNDYVKDYSKVIENKTGIKFNDLILSREYNLITQNNKYSKDLSDYIQELIIKALSDKYKKDILEKNRKLIFTERMIIIDDNQVIWNDNPNLVICPPYNYVPIVELNQDILNLICKNNAVMSFIQSTSAKNMIFPPISVNGKSNEEVRQSYHLFMADAYLRNMDVNLKSLKDDFFQKFSKALKSRKTIDKPFTKAFIKKLNSNNKQTKLNN